MNQISTKFTLKINKLVCCFFLLFICLGKPTDSIAQNFVHPGIPFNTADLNQLKINITQEPWLSAYNKFKLDNRSSLNYVMQGPFSQVGRAPNVNMGQWDSDMIAIHNLAFMWVLTGDTAYAKKATNILDAWATTHVVNSGGEMFLEVSDYVHYVVTGADILKSTYPGWTAANTTHVNNYFRTILLPLGSVNYPLRGLNQGAAQLKISMSISAFLDDTVIWQQVIEQFRRDAGGGLACSLPNGQVGDAGRDNGHWFGEVSSLAWAAEVAWKQGVDMFSELDNRILAASELYTRFNTDTTGLYGKFIPFGGIYGYYTSYGTTGGGTPLSYLYNIVEGAYSVRKGLPAPNTIAFRNLRGENNNTWMYRKSADNSVATPLQPVNYPTTTLVSNITNLDIGSSGIAGSANFNNGVWTVKGAGNSIGDAVNFNFQSITGNATIIAKITSNSLSGASSGLMIRQSLSTGSTYLAYNMSAAGGVNYSSRGLSGSSVGNHPNPRAPWWLKLERLDDRVYAYHSVDGIHWTCSGIFLYPASTPAYLGFYTISNNTSALNTATFTNVGITSGTPVGAPSITSATSATGTIGSSFNYAITADQNPTTFSASGLPQGLSIDTLTGVVSGTPTTLGKTLVNLGAKNTNGTGTIILAINVANNAAPAKPANFIATVVNNTQIRLTWNAVANISSYTIKRSLSSTGPFTTIQTGINSTSFTDPNPVPEVTNYYVVTALSGTLESPNSNVVSGAVPPAVPVNLISVSGNSKIDLSWDAAAGAQNYRVKRSLTIGGPYSTVATVPSPSYSDLNLTNGNPYYYVVSSLGSTKESANSQEVYGSPGTNSFTWKNVSNTDSLNLADNWVENMVPVSPAIINFRASADTTLINDISNLTVSRLNFDTDAPSYSISGNGVTINNDIVNKSTGVQKLNTPVVLSKQVQINNIGGITISGAISGDGGISKSGMGLLDLTNAGSTYKGNTEIVGTVTGFPARNGIQVGGVGTGTSGTPLSGPLGTGKIIMSGGSLTSISNAVLYNDVVITTGKNSIFTQVEGGLNIKGRLTGGGTLINDGNVFGGLHFSGDNSGFTGTFLSNNRSSNHRIRFDSANSGSAQAIWDFGNTFSDGHGLAFGAGTIYFGALRGRGPIRQDNGTTSIVNIGALNLSTSYSGPFEGAFSVEKVGTGSFTMTGSSSHTGTTTIKAGKFFLNNNPTTGTFMSPVTVVAGAFGGSGLSTSNVTIGNGSGTGAGLEPGSPGIGTLSIANLTLNKDATLNIEISKKNTTADKVKVTSCTLTSSPQLVVAAIDTGSLALGTSFTLIENTGNSPISGTFKDLPELFPIDISGSLFRITYKGGTGNDIVLLDNRTVPIMINSALIDTAKFNSPYTYTITAIQSPTVYRATGLPTGLTIDTLSGVINGIPTEGGPFSVTLSASNATSTATATLSLFVKVDLIVQNITFPDLPAATLTTADFAPGATSTSSLPITYSSSNLSVATVVNGNIHIVGAGTATIMATQAGNWQYAPTTLVKYLTVTGIAAGDYVSSGTMNWSGGTWNISNGNGGYSGTTATAPTSSINVHILSGHTVTVNTTSSVCKNFTLQAGGTLATSNAGSNLLTTSGNTTMNGTVTGVKVTANGDLTVNGLWNLNGEVVTTKNVYIFPTGIMKGSTTAGGTVQTIKFGGTNPTILIEGQLGGATTGGSGESIRMYTNGTGNYTFTGSGKVYLARFQPDNGSAIQNIAIDVNMSFNSNQSASTGFSLQNNGNGSGLKSLTIKAGKTLSLTNSGCGFHGPASSTDGSSAVLGNMTYNIEGTLNLAAAPFILYTNTTSSGQQLTINVKEGGILKLGSITKMGIQSAGQNINVNVATGGTVDGSTVAMNIASSSNNKVVSGVSTGPIWFTLSPGAIYKRMVAATTATPFWIGPTNNSYNPVTVKPTTGTVFQVGVVSGIVPTGFPDTTQVINRTWSVAPSLASATDINFGYNDTDAASIAAPAAEMKLGFYNQSTSQWQASAVKVLPVAGIGTARNVSFTGINSFPSFVIFNEIPQTISFNGITAKNIDEPDFDPAATVSSGLPIIYNSSDTTVATITSNHKIHIVKEGSSTITATQPGNSFYGSATPVSQSLVVNKLQQTITFNELPDKNIGDADFEPGATSSSGLPLAYNSSDTTVATITIDGKIHIKGAGITSITATQSGNAIYATAIAISQSLTVSKLPQAITFNALTPKNIGDEDFDPIATTTSGLPVYYISSDTTVAIINNIGKIHLLNNGTTTITASQPGNAIFGTATSVSQLLTVNKSAQTITFNALPTKNMGDADFDPQATASSGLALTYSSSDTTIATITTSGKIHIKAAGSTSITANQSGNAIYSAAIAVSQLLTVNSFQQTITFSALPSKKVGDADFNPTASTSSGLPISLSSSDVSVATITSDGKIRIEGVGTTTITASQHGNATYNPASPINQTFTVSPINISLNYLNTDANNPSDNNIKPDIQLVNNGTTALNYSEFKIRYWFTAENFAGINTWVDYAQIGSGKVQLTYVNAGQPRTGAFGYVEYSFDPSAGLLSAGGSSGPIRTRFANTDWSVFNESDDYSYNSTSSYQPNNHITVYRNGLLVWGVEPSAVTPQTQLTVLSQNTNTNSSSNTISNYLQINNTGNVPVAYSDLSIRYWFTADGSSPLNYMIDHAKMGASKISGQFVTTVMPLNKADTYLEIKINPSAGNLNPLSGSGNIQHRIRKDNWSNFNETNDFSYRPAGQFATNPNITVYYKGALIYGTEPVATVGQTTAAVNNNIHLSSVNEPNVVKTNTVYPNPVVNSYFFIKVTPDLHDKVLQVKVYGPEGSMFLNKQLRSDASGNVRVDLNQSGRLGVYSVMINNLLPIKFIYQNGY